MGTIADKLAYLNATKDAIKNAIVAKGVDVPDGTTFRQYADKVAEISGAKTCIVTIEPFNPGDKALILVDSNGSAKEYSYAGMQSDSIQEEVLCPCIVYVWSTGVLVSGLIEKKLYYTDLSFNKTIVALYVSGDGTITF